MSAVSQMQEFAKAFSGLMDRHRGVRADALTLAIQIGEYRKTLRSDLERSPERDKAMQLALSVQKKLMAMAGPAVPLNEEPRIVVPS